MQCDRWCSTVISMVPTHLARTGALWRPGGAAERETFVGLIRAKLQRRLVGQNKVLEATPSLSLPHAYTPGYFPALDRYRGPVALRRAAMDASQGLTASWSQEPVPRRAAAGFDVEASLWQALQVDLTHATCLASQHLAEATAREYRHVLPYFRTSRACAWSVHETTPMVQDLGWRGGW